MGSEMCIRDRPGGEIETTSRAASQADERGRRGVILTVTLNVALDRTVAVPRIALGNRHRAVDVRTAAGGKGVNVARALKALGEPVIATGLAAGPTGARIRELLDDEQVLHDFTEVAGDSRTNLSIVDPTSGEQTEINERGPQISDADLNRFTERLLYLGRGGRRADLRRPDRGAAGGDRSGRPRDRHTARRCSRAPPQESPEAGGEQQPGGEIETSPREASQA